MTNEATAAYAPINRPSWDHIAQLCGLFRFRGDSGPLDMQRADDADAFKRLPSAKAGELASVASLQNPISRMAHGFVTRTQLFAPAAPVLH